MTTNQRRAAEIAEALVAGEKAAGLTDEEWYLLLLAGDTNRLTASPLFVARRVLRRAAAGTGYFAQPARAGSPARAASARGNCVEYRPGRRVLVGSSGNAASRMRTVWLPAGPLGRPRLAAALASVSG